MNLQENIRRILREELSLLMNLTDIRRRTYLIDKSINKFIKHLHPEYYETKQKYLDKLISLVAEDLHGDYFVYSELPDEEWDVIKEFISQYITQKY
jgi:hypothetical protein